jgi:tetratricopeptide (TPR) repeat protein
MSLLMDALKKAEQDKKEAAKRLKDAKPQDQSLDEITQTQESNTEDDLAHQTSELVLPDENHDRLDDNAKVEGLTLSPVDNQESIFEEDSSIQDSPLLDLSESDPHRPVSARVNENILAIVEDDDSAADDMEFKINEDIVSGISPDQDQKLAPAPIDLQVDESPTLRAEDTVQGVQELDDADSIVKGVDEYEYFSATVSAVQLAQDIGVDSPTPVAAQTVFTAISTKSDNQVLQWGAFVILCLAIAGAISFLIIDTIPVERSIKSPLVAKGIETQSEPVPVIEIPDELVSSTEVDSRLFTSEITDVIKKENDTVVEEGPAGSEATRVTEINSEEVSGNITGSRPGEELMNENSVHQLAITQEKVWYPAENNVSEEDFSVTEVVEEATLALPEQIVLEPELIKISRSISTDKSSVLINKAYQEYLAGDYDAAEKSYHSVLKKLPENRDSLLGLAAISIRKGHVRQAYTNYLEVLRLYPGDSVAEAALINFKRNGDYLKDESILKTFIQREPDNSFLYYSLGHLHAVQRRWPEAQQSFFNAYRLETSNPDYAFNLAVSLDHIGQQQSAIDYYNVALKLADNSTAGFATVSFDRAVVISRLNALSSLADLQ